MGSRKDFRNAVVAARKAQPAWNGKTAYNKSQIIYRIAEVLESRKTSFIEECIQMGLTKLNAEAEVLKSIDRLVYFAGWCDKYQQVFSSVNPVASSHFNFSVYEPMGVVTLIAPQDSPLLGFISCVIPVICGGNTAVVLASEKFPLSSISFAEVLNASDVPAGVINIITGTSSELLSHFANHMDVNAIIYSGKEDGDKRKIQQLATENLKRVVFYTSDFYKTEACENPYMILDTQEVKTTWHPIENIGVGGSKY